MFIVVSSDGRYLTNRRATGTLYENRAGFSEHLKDAKVFNTRSAATNSANRVCSDFTVKEVRLQIV